MKSAFSTRLAIYWFSSCAFIALSGCNLSDGNNIETPATVSSTAGETNQDVAGEPSEDVGATPTKSLGDMHSGEATFYRATGEGNCSFDASDDLMVAAINTKDYATAAMCGAYIAVSGPDGTVTVRIVDRCPGCGQGGLDLSRQAFARIADPVAGRVPVTWQIVSGPTSGPIAYHYMDGTTRYWTAIQVRNHRWPVAALEVMPKGATGWIRVERRSYNYFVHPKPIPAGELRVRVTAVTGATLEDELPEPAGGLLVQGVGQFQ